MTTNRLLATLLIASMAIDAPRAASAAETVTCPAVFPMQTLHFGPTADGWKPETGERPPRLIGFGLYSGPPAQLAQLQETTVSKGRAIWNLAPPYAGGLWVQCVYADGALTLSRRLSTTSGVCSAPDTLPRQGKPRLISLVCK
jgi:poly(3-hydroxybutyrate) depolymerase